MRVCIKFDFACFSKWSFNFSNNEKITFLQQSNLHNLRVKEKENETWYEVDNWVAREFFPLVFCIQFCHASLFFFCFIFIFDIWFRSAIHIYIYISSCHLVVAGVVFFFHIIWSCFSIWADRKGIDEAQCQLYLRVHSCLLKC